ncbi:YrhK family protein [Paenibacillus bovis]|nr:YrhK family protein [Paenibacillus bovis]
MRKHRINRSAQAPVRSRRMRIHKPDSYKLAVDFKKRRLVAENRYELISLLNDMITTICFLVGSYFFFTSQTKTGTIMFVIGNANTLFRAILSLVRKIHVEWMNEQSQTAEK